MALQELISCSLSLVDNLMVGSLGEAELAAVGVAVQIFFINWMMMYGFTSGSATFMAQFYGAKDFKNIRKTMGFALTVCFSIGVLFFVASFFMPEKIVRLFSDIPDIIDLGTKYVKIGSLTFFFVSITLPLTSAFRATQQTRIPLYISFAAFSTNTFLNYVLIFGKFGAPAMGVEGAAVATVIARVLETALILYVLFGRKNILAGPLSQFFGWHKEFALRIVKNALPTTVNETLWGLGTAMYAAAYARIGITEYAAVQAAITINNMFSMAAFSVGSATLILVGQKLGEGDLDYAYELGRRLVRIGVFVGVVAGLMLIAVAKPLISLFDFSDEASRYCFIILVIYGLFMGMNLHNGIQVTGILRAGGDTRFAMVSECSCIWFIGVPVAFITTMVLGFPVYIAVLCVKLEEIVKCFILIYRFKSKKWVRNVIDKMDS